MARVNGVQWYDENQTVTEQNRQPNWDFYSATPVNPPPNAGPSNPPPPPPPASFHGFSALPAELRNIVWDADLETEEPVMRFVCLRQSVRHFPGCTQLAGCACFAQRPNYITFHPLLRSDLDILVGLMMGEYWEAICRTTDRPSRAQVASYVNHERRTAALSTRAQDPTPHRQGDWSLTQIPQDVRNADIVGEPWRCNEQDLVFVRFPGDMDPRPMYTFNAHTTDPFVAFDPVVEQLTTIAMYVNNWDANSGSRCVENAHNRMRRNRSWQRVQQRGLDAILNETTGAAGQPAWPPADVLAAATRYPIRPQRELRPTHVQGNMPPWDQNMRLFTDVFTGLRHLWLVDWGMYWHTADVAVFDEYRNANCRSDEYCDACGYAHPGYPRVWGGLAEVEFIEVRQCWPHWGCEVEEMFWSGYRRMFLDHWPQFDVNGLPFLRQRPNVGIIACIIRRPQA